MLPSSGAYRKTRKPCDRSCFDFHPPKQSFKNWQLSLPFTQAKENGSSDESSWSNQVQSLSSRGGGSVAAGGVHPQCLLQRRRPVRREEFLLFCFSYFEMKWNHNFLFFVLNHHQVRLSAAAADDQVLQEQPVLAGRPRLRGERPAGLLAAESGRRPVHQASPPPVAGDHRRLPERPDAVDEHSQLLLHRDSVVAGDAENEVSSVVFYLSLLSYFVVLCFWSYLPCCHCFGKGPAMSCRSWSPTTTSSRPASRACGRPSSIVPRICSANASPTRSEAPTNRGSPRPVSNWLIWWRSISFQRRRRRRTRTLLLKKTSRNRSSLRSGDWDLVFPSLCIALQYPQNTTNSYHFLSFCNLFIDRILHISD